MDEKGKEFVKSYIARNLKLSRAVEGRTNRIGSTLGDFHKGIKERIEKEYSSLSSKTLRKLNKQIKKDMREFHAGALAHEVGVVAGTIIGKEIAWNVKTMSEFVGKKLKIANSEAVAAKALKKTYQGHTFDFWFRAAGKTSARRVTKALSAGYITGAPAVETSRNISAILGRTGNDIKTLSRSYFQHAAVQARYDSMAANSDIIEEYVWWSVLDIRTTPNICGIRDSKRYNKKFEPIGHSLPWDEGPGRIHFNCRSNFIPRMKGEDDISKHLIRPSVGSGKNYQSGDNKTRTGKVRKPTRKNTEKGIFDVNRVHGSTDYESFLKNQNHDYITDVFSGNSKAATDFKAGRINLLDFAKAGTSSDFLNL